MDGHIYIPHGVVKWLLKFINISTLISLPTTTHHHMILFALISMIELKQKWLDGGTYTSELTI